MLKHKKSVIYNGEYFYENNLPIDHRNRAFLYGDSAFETIKASDMRVLFFREHIERLRHAASLLKIVLPEKFTTRPDRLLKEIIALLNRNKHYKTARIRIHAFRKPGGFFSPADNGADYIIQTSVSEKKTIKQACADVYTQTRVIASPFSRYKIGGNFKAHILAGIYKKQHHLDDCILLNDRGEICEATAANLFLLKNNCIYTPASDSGCVLGIIRSKMKELAAEIGADYKEKPLSITELLSADELFTSNSLQGIQSFVVFGKKRYFTKKGEKISGLLTKLEKKSGVY